jgi:hypothetical protein
MESLTTFVNTSCISSQRLCSALSKTLVTDGTLEQTDLEAGNFDKIYTFILTIDLIAITNPATETKVITST